MRGHICQCLTRLLTPRPITIFNERIKKGNQFVQNVLNLAHCLSQLGLKPAHIVAICAFNSDWYLEWLLAVAYVGGILAPLNYRWCLEETRLALEVIRPVLIVTDDSCKWLSELQNGTIFSPRWHVSIDSYSSSNNVKKESSVMKCDTSSSINFCWAPEDVAIICFTSGTTGKPKGVPISHTALIMQSLAKLAIVGYSEDDVYLHTAPLCHIGGISSALAMLMAGGCHVFLPKFESKLAVQAIEENKVTSFITVPAIMADLISTIRLKESSNCGQCLKKILNGGGSLSAQLVKEATQIFPRAKLVSAYGMTEASSSITFITLYDPATKNSNQHLDRLGEVSYSVNSNGGSCVGKPAPHVEMMIMREDSSNIGRIMTRGPHVMVRYWGQNAATVSSYDGQWLDTGDIGQIDAHGNLWLVGRRNGRIKSGGENVYPEEVEAVVSKHPGVVAVVIVGLPHGRLGEMVVACVQIKENWTWTEVTSSETPSNNIECLLSSEVLKQHCRKLSLTRFKIPKVFMVWKKPFPVTSTGKLKRNQVKMEAMLNIQPLISNL